jgi:hypothetical protein
MTPHKGIIILERLDQRRDGLRALKVSQRHRHIAEKASALGPEDRTTTKTAAKLLLTKGEQRYQLRRIQTFAGRKGSLLGVSCLDVVRTNFLADITAEDVIAHQRAQMPWNGPFELDRQIRDTAAGIEYVGTDEGAGGTGLEAEIAPAAPVPDRPVIGQLDA